MPRPGNLALGVILAATLSPVGAAEPRLQAADVDKAVENARKVWSVPGVALVVVQGEKTVHLKAYGVKQVGRAEPLSVDSLFPMASCTKAFTSAVIAALADEGSLGWDDPVRKHLPSFRLADEAADKLVVIRDLLTHRSGLAGHDLIWYRAPWDQAEVLKRISKLPLTAPFRASYQYSSLPFLAAGAAIASRTGAGWDTVLDEKICTPLGMKTVAFTRAGAEKIPDRAVGHQKTRDGMIERMPEYDNREPDAAGSLYTTPRDLAAWLAMHLNQGKFVGKQVISAKNLAETKLPHTPMRLEGRDMLSTYPRSTQVSYAMGWVVFDYRGHKVIAHGGLIDGFRIQITLLPDVNLGFALLNNLHETRMNQSLAYTLIDQFLGLSPVDWDAHFLKAVAQDVEEKAELRKRREAERDPALQPSLPLEQFAGVYEHPAYGEGRLAVQDRTLVWTWSSFRCPLEAWSGDRFRITAGYFEDDLVNISVQSGAPLSLQFKGIPFRFVKP